MKIGASFEESKAWWSQFRLNILLFVKVVLSIFATFLSNLGHRCMVIPRGEKFSQNAPGRPNVNLNSIVRISIQKFRRTVVPRWDVSDWTARQFRLSCLLDLFQSCVVIFKQLCAAKVTYFQGGFSLWICDSFRVNENVVRFYVSMSDAFWVQVSQAFKKLVTELFDRCGSLFPNPLNLGLIGGFCNLLHGFQSGFNVKATHRLRHEVTHQIQIFTLSFPNKRHQKCYLSVRIAFYNQPNYAGKDV